MYYDSYNTINVLEKYIPVDVYINGCMPRPEAVIAGFKQLQDKIARGDADNGTRYKENLDWYRANQQQVIKNWRMPDYNW
jgi:NADH-quinone oxidoreductase subunit B